MKLAQCIGLTLLSAVLTGCATRNDNQMKAIPYSFLQSKFTILGKCGHPLGTCIRIEGQWKRRGGRTKADPRYFEVESINGQKVQNVVQFAWGELVAVGDQEMPQWGENAVWEMVGYESGKFSGAPKEMLAALEQVVQPGPPYGFYVYFAFYKCSPGKGRFSTSKGGGEE